MINHALGTQAAEVNEALADRDFAKAAESLDSIFEGAGFKGAEAPVALKDAVAAYAPAARPAASAWIGFSR